VLKSSNITNQAPSFLRAACQSEVPFQKSDHKTKTIIKGINQTLNSGASINLEHSYLYIFSSNINNVYYITSHIGYNVDMNKISVGVGPHPKPWPTDIKYDTELLANGDTFNVIDKYRYWKIDAIKADLDKSRVPLHIAVENWQHDFNIGTIVRSANAFNIEAVHIIGKKHWNRRGAMVTDRYMNIINHQTVDEFAELMKNDKRQIIAVDILPGAVNISETELPEKSVLVFGGEGPGLSEEMQKSAEKIVMIEQFGSTRSVNVGVAAGIAMYAWMQQNVLKK